jgi:hypothetical protein
MTFDEKYIQENQIKIEIDNLISFDYYPLKHFRGRRLEEMKEDIRSAGICDPIIVRPADNANYEILNGHYRVAAAKELEWKSVPAVVLSGLSDEKALEYLSDTNPVGLLKKYGIDIYSDDYRKSDGYKQMKNARIFVDDGFSMALDEYIEQFLLNKYKVSCLYESIYSMGNTYELDEEECTDEAVARNIIQINDPERENDIEAWRESKDYSDSRALKNAEESINREVNELTNLFGRQDGGYIQQIKKYLGVDLETFDYSNLQNMRERAKILFFVYRLKNKYFCDVNILKLLSKPSMENNDNSFLGWETHNGQYISFIKHEIEKEISPAVKHRVKKEVSSVVNTWGDYMNSGCRQIAQLLYIGYDCSQEIFSLSKRTEETVTYQELMGHPAPSATPLELLYLRMVQYEYLGQMCDLLKIHEMAFDVNYSVPVEYIGEMQKFQVTKVSRKDIDTYFEPENVQKIAKYVYLKSEIDKEDRRRIRSCKDKMLRFLDFINLADPLGEYNMMEDVTELLIISCLQSILLDKGKEIFDYTFYRMEGISGERKGKIYVHAALKKEKRPYDALQVYWVRRVVDRSYANVGDSNIRRITQEYERICVKTLLGLLKCASVEEMLKLSEFYSCKLTLLVKPKF